MKTLILIRHAKSSWESFDSDFDRPLIKKGKDEIRLIAKSAITLLPKKFTFWSSDAKRASETALIFANEINYPTEKIYFKRELYTFDENELEKCIKSCSNDCESLILFGHNEAITFFVNKFGDLFIDNVPTAGLVVMQFETEKWSEIKNGKTIKALFPKNLK